MLHTLLIAFALDCLMSSSAGVVNLCAMLLCRVARQVGFRDQKLIRRLKVETRLNAVVNRLNATKREENPDLAAEREAYEKEAGFAT